MKLTGFRSQWLFEPVARLDELLLVAQVRGAVRQPGRRLGRERRVVVERLVVVLEQVVRALRPGCDRRVDVRVGAAGRRRRRPRAVRPAGVADVAVGVRPAAGVPGPVDAFRRQPVADRRVRLCREPRRKVRRRLEGRCLRVDRVVAAGESGDRRRQTARLRQHPVDQAAVRRRVERAHPRRPVRHWRRGRNGKAIAVEHGMRGIGRAAVRCVAHRRRRCDQPLMVQV